MRHIFSAIPPLDPAIVIGLWSVLCGCAGGGSGGGIGPAVPAPGGIDSWTEVVEQLEAHPLENLALIVGDAGGEVFRYEKGAFRVNDQHPVASASKWLTSTTIMVLVEQGVLHLDDRPQDVLSYWTNDPADPRSQITLAQLLSFTAGFHVGPRDPTCIGDTRVSLQACVEILYDAGLDAPPGTTYFYGPVHMQVAAAMAEVATGQPWADIVQLNVAGPLAMSTTGFAADHPRASGSAVSSALDYSAFLQGHLSGWLSSDALDELTRARLDDVTVVSQPAAVDLEDGDWSYGLGVWRECNTPQWSETCADQVVVSSAGAFGWYPWLDLNREYYAVLAVNERPTFFLNPAAVSIELGQVLQPLIRDALGR